MANLAEKHDEKHNEQLADAEISRILSALQKAEFKRSETGNARPDQAFKPRSLMEIAETARRQDEAEKAVTIDAETAADKADHATEKTVDNTITDMADGSGDVLAGGKAHETKGDDQSSEQLSASVLDHTPQDTSFEKLPKESNIAEPLDLLAAGAGADADTQFDNSTDQGVGFVSSTSPFETAQTAYDRGYADGVAAGHEAAEAELRKTIEADFEAKLADKINTFETVLTALKKPQSVDTRALSASLQEAVVRLAAARTGTAIDQLPELMIKRIENLADAAGKNISAGHVFMHPDDCAVIAPIMETRQGQFKFESDPELYRGDIRIRFDGMDISDIADLRADWQISQSMADEISAEFETAQTKISDVELEAQAANNLGPDSQDASTHSNIMSSSLKDDSASDEETGDTEDALSSEAIGLMPLTTTGGDDFALDGKNGDNEGASSSEAIGLMPLTTTGGDDSASDGENEDNEGASSSEAIGLMPLTTNKIEE